MKGIKMFRICQGIRMEGEVVEWLKKTEEEISLIELEVKRIREKISLYDCPLHFFYDSICSQCKKGHHECTYKPKI